MDMNNDVEMRKLLVNTIRSFEHSSPIVAAFRAAYSFRQQFASPDEADQGPAGLERALERALTLFTLVPPIDDHLTVRVVETDFLQSLAKAAERLPSVVIRNFIRDLHHEGLDSINSPSDLRPVLEAAFSQYIRLSEDSLFPGP